MQPIDHVNFTFQGSTDQLVAAGSCRIESSINLLGRIRLSDLRQAKDRGNRQRVHLLASFT